MNWHRWLLAVIAAIVAVGLSALSSFLSSLLREELDQWCRPLADWILRRAARLLPPEHRDHWMAVWLADLDMLKDRKLAVVVKALSIRAGASHLRRVLLGTSSAHPLIVTCYSIVVPVGGLTLGVVWAVHDGGWATGGIDGRFFLLWGLGLLLDCRSAIILNRVGKVEQVGGSLFDYALLLGWAAGVSVPAIIVAGVSSYMISHRHERPALGKALFNAGQFALAASAAILVLKGLGADQPGGSTQDIAIVVGMATYAIANTMLTRIAVALDRTSANLRALRSGWQLDVAEWALLAGLAQASAFAVGSLVGIVLLVPATVAYSVVLTYVDKLVSPHIHLPE